MVSPRDQLSCRICWGQDSEAGMGRLISPCLCSGSIKYVHTSCLNSWCISQPRGKGPTRCEMCRSRYQIPNYARSAFDEEVWDEFPGGPRAAMRRLVRSAKSSLSRRTPRDWLLAAPSEIIMLGGFVRGFLTAAPVSGYFARLAWLGAQAGGAAFARSLPGMALLSLVIPHRMRVSLAVSVGAYIAVLGLQVPLYTLVGLNVGWCFGYVTGCAEVAEIMRNCAVGAARPLLGCLSAILRFGLRRLLPSSARARLR